MSLKSSRIDLIVTLITVCVFATLIGMIGSSKSDFDMTHRYLPVRSGSEATDVAGLAGEYYRSVGLGFRYLLSILPDGRYSFIESGCTGVHRRESGLVQETEGRYVLSPSEPSEPSIERDFVLIGWGQRHYLVPPGEMQELRDAIIEGREPRDDARGRFYIRLPIAPADGLPDSPPEWASSLSEDLLLGAVTEVSTVGLAKIGRAKVDLGAKDGLREGDILTVQSRGYHLDRRLRIVSVADRSCVADECFPGSSKHPLEIGMAIVTVRFAGGNGPR
jgi:hypothetical protein